MFPKVIETKPVPIKLFKGTKYCSTCAQRPITLTAQATIALTYVDSKKQQKLN